MLWYWALRVWLVNDDFIAGTSRGGLSRQHDVGVLVPAASGPWWWLGACPWPSLQHWVLVLWKCCTIQEAKDWKSVRRNFSFSSFAAITLFLLLDLFILFSAFLYSQNVLCQSSKPTSLNASIHVFMAKHFLRILVKKNLTRVLYERGRRKLSSDAGRRRMVLVDCSCLHEVNLSSKPFYLPMLSKSRKPKSRSHIIWPAAQQGIFDLSLLSSPSCFIHETQTSDHHHLALALCFCS